MSCPCAQSSSVPRADTASLPLTVEWHAHNTVKDWHETLFFHPTPVGPKQTRNFVIDSVSFMGDEWSEIARAFQDVVNEQDGPIVESQRPEELPEDLAQEMHPRAVDTYSLFYRQWLLELARELEPASTEASN